MLLSFGVQAARVTLHLDCINRPVQFAPGLPSTCVDAATLSAPPDRGIDTSTLASAASTLAGTTELAKTTGCRTVRPNSQCIPGGFFLLGDQSLSETVEPQSLLAAPLRPVWSSPFHLDTTEFTVGRYRALRTAHPDLMTPDAPETRSCRSIV